MPKHDPAPAFRALHQRGNPFVLMNAWDVGSARIMAAMGAQAIGTTSSGYGFTQGLPDMGHLTRDQHLDHAADIVAATPLPVSGDFENGFGDAPEDVAETIRLACEAGLAGCSIEDTMLPSATPYDFALAVDRIRAGADAARNLPRDFVLVARADGIMNGQYDVSEAIKRLQAFDAAGADCLYAPLPASMDDLKLICDSVSKPVNGLAAGAYTKYNRADFANIGVARISLGSALSRVTHQAIVDCSQSILHDGGFASLSSGASGGDIDVLLAKGSV
ncbi:PEP phosphonomutase [Amylibacter kogurei]|uniref:PEP phosphonomutase n=1 Tax=Paramylibacter kogurei TaxID=1889778 RepID=A0A2G5K637_9RHOB|nr:isocitrate lyase/phosphoenolpyruvate mutase family protein [Amylibacter kogurei]PIB24998.1 PEP phosphonomutase [Amylibacter kogurei]